MLRHRWTPWVLLAALVVAHFAMLARFVRGGYAAPDADGYYAQARMLVFEGRPDFEAESALQHLGMHWLEKADGRFISRYPPGLPLVIGAAWAAFGRGAALYVDPLLAALTLPAVFLLCLPYTGPWLALAAAFVQAAEPTANRHALSADSHTLTTLCLVAGLALLDRWGRRGGRWTALAAGFALAYIPLVRYAEAAAAVGVVAFLALVWRRAERRPEIPYVLAGALVPALGLAVHNEIHFGAFWRTAYALTGESNLSLAYLARNWSVYCQALLSSGVGYFIAPGLLGLLLMLREEDSRPFAAAAGLAAGSITLLYCCYYFAMGGAVGSLRFLLPTLPLYLPPAFYFLRKALPGATLAPGVAALLFFQGTMGQPSGLHALEAQASSAEVSAAAIRGLEEIVPQGAVLLGDRRLHEQLNFTGEWRLADDDALLPGEGRRRPQGGPPGGGPGGFGGPPGMDDAPDQPSPMQRGKGKDLRARYDRLPPPQRLPAMLGDLETWAGSAGVYWALTGDERTPRLPEGYELDVVGRIELPQPEQPEGRPGLGGRRRGPAGGGFPRRMGPGGMGPGGFGPGGMGQGGPGPGGLGPGGPGGGPGFGLSGEPITVYRLVGPAG
ncbi:MAG: hypothetical protein GC160_05180 [Acidobacteria bacterium]|nr:hypothetical protein [Acidobacteriota bacterium]